MTGRATVVFDDELTSYDFGLGHPLAPIRVDLTMRLARALGVLDRADVSVIPAPTATNDQLRLVHTQEYIDAVCRMSESPHDVDLAHGLGTEDDPCFGGMQQASSHIVGASLAAAGQVFDGSALHAVNISGGLHHAMANGASGFCIYNDPAIAIAWLLEQGVDRIAYVDIDVHHGDGVQAAFYDDPRVLTISLHESPKTLFPGTGDPSESGGPHALGTSMNVALPPGTGDGGWLRAFNATVPAVIEAFNPDILVSQHGCDSHSDDPLAHLMLSVDGQREAHQYLHDLAHKVCDGRWLALGGGGYSVVDVVPRTWTHLLAVVCGEPLDPKIETPHEWREYVERYAGRSAPTVMTDGVTPEYVDWSNGYDPDSWLDRCIVATRREVFPYHGLDPEY